MPSEYPDPLGPTVDYMVDKNMGLFGRNLSYEDALIQVINASATPNTTIDSVLGPFGDWLDAKSDSYILSLAGG